jgi:hypothetical protein
VNSLVGADFSLCNEWTPYKLGPKWTDYPKIPAYLIDGSTGRLYWNESEGVVGFKCALLTLGTPIVHATVGLASKIFHVITLSALRKGGGTLKERFTEFGKDLARLVFLPLGIIALEAAALYGVFSPYNGRKLYASLERACYKGYLLAPCFQPSPTHHFFGGDSNKRNAF